MNLLCEDMINEITNYCDQKSIASLFSVNKFTYSLSKKHPEIKKRKLLSDELKKTNIKVRKYYTSEILDLKIGDRVTDRIKNYRVFEIKKRIGILEVIDLYGNSLNEYVTTNVYNIKKYKINDNNNSFWSTIYYNEFQNTSIINKLLPGMIKHEYGPLINNLDSYYLNYHTEPQYIFFTNDSSIEPIYNMLVTISYKWYIYEYYIHKFTEENRIELKIVNEIKDLASSLIADKLNSKWILHDKKYKIINFGGWNSRL
jgi:hypothetical protein